jgi:GMP synthase (glutamine-hydrolysing)
MMEKILVVDFGSQYTQLLARMIREVGVYSQVVDPFRKMAFNEVKGIILSGGPKSVKDDNALKVPENVYSSGIPILGVCYGMQRITVDFGGEVERTGLAEYGKTKIKIVENSQIFEGVDSTFTAWMSHSDSVVNLPKDSTAIAVTENSVIAGYKIKNKDIYSLQFHPEVAHTQFGNKIIENFVFKVCNLKPNWSLEKFVDLKVEELKEKMGDSGAIIGLSGGVDSSVAAVLVHKAIGKNLKAVFVDHGLVRMGEVEEVKNIFSKTLGENLIIVDSKRDFLSKLKGVVDPERKRKIIGEEFIRAFEGEAKKYKDIKYLVQGTIYSDVIESAASGSKTSKIKSHHNVGGLPEKIGFEIVEPLRELFKDEVRKLGEILDIPKSVLYRHPFPGPGLAIRIIGEITEKKLEILKKADKIFIDTLKSENWYYKIWQAFAVLTDVKTVGVVGDERNYEYVLALRAVNSVEGMTADWSKIPYDILEKASNRITGEIREVGRVVYDITSKPPATIEWE